MLTGRALYSLAGKALGVDLEARPQDIALDLVACRAGGWFWRYKKVDRFADTGDLTGSRKAWNGGYIGLREVRVLYDIARSNFGLSAQE
jgi:putative chitinase